MELIPSFANLLECLDICSFTLIMNWYFPCSNWKIFLILVILDMVSSVLLYCCFTQYIWRLLPSVKPLDVFYLSLSGQICFLHREWVEIELLWSEKILHAAISHRFQNDSKGTEKLYALKQEGKRGGKRRRNE